jgi:hypothetical protein
MASFVWQFCCLPATGCNGPCEVAANVRSLGSANHCTKRWLWTTRIRQKSRCMDIGCPKMCWSAEHLFKVGGVEMWSVFWVWLHHFGKSPVKGWNHGVVGTLNPVYFWIRSTFKCQLAMAFDVRFHDIRLYNIRCASFGCWLHIFHDVPLTSLTSDDDLLRAALVSLPQAKLPKNWAADSWSFKRVPERCHVCSLSPWGNSSTRSWHPGSELGTDVWKN